MGHFGDESFQSITCTQPNKNNQATEHKNNIK